MKTEKTSIIRPCGRRTDILPIAVAASLLLTLAGQFLGGFFFSTFGIVNFLNRVTGSVSVGNFLSMYATFIGIWMVFFLVASVFRSNHPMISAVGYNRTGNNPRWALIGLLLGVGTNGLCILAAWLMGDIKLFFNGFRPWLLLAFFAAVIIQSGAEELADRCYLYQKLRRRYSHPAAAVIVNSVVFAAMHLLNPGVTAVSVAGIAVIGLVFSLLVCYHDSLWAAIMMHAGWNFTQSILFGLPNSGIVSEYSLFRLEAASARNGFFYNVNFGVEGSVGSLIVLLAVLAVLFVTGHKRGEKRDYWA